MKRNIKLLLIMMIPLMLLSACIFSTTPPAGTVNLTWSQNQTFKVSGMGSYQWFLDGAQVGTGSTYTFKSSAHVLGTYNLKVTSTFSMGGIGVINGERKWDIHVTSVPALVPTATSCSDITNVGLICNTAMSCSPTVAQGDVITQTPAPGESVPAGSTVQLLISSGPCVNHEVEVPAATGCASLAAAGFICSTTTSCSNELPAGMVLFQDPPAGTLAMQGTTVNLVLSSGPCTAEVEVPNATSCADVEAAGFVCSRIRECSMTVPLDGVITQSPPPGFMAIPGSVVALTLSSGMCQAQVPNATTCEEIVAAGLVCNKVEICTNDYPVPGTFLSLSPAAGTGISPGSTVTLTVSNGPCTVEVPDAASCDDITATGWLTCNLEYECSDSVPAGTKLSQDPAPGSMVEPGTAVRLVFASGPCPIKLPTPTNVSATDVILVSQTDPMQNHNLDNKITVTWDAVEGAEYYKIYRSNTAIGTYTYAGRTTGTETTFNDMQSNQEIPTLVLPPFPSLPSDDPAQATANLDAYEAAARPIVGRFKSFVYYKVTAATTDPAYTDSLMSAYDEGRMDYTIDEFYTVMKSVTLGIPMSRLFIAANPIGLGTNVTWYDNCGDGYLNLKIYLSGLSGKVEANMVNFIETLAYNELIGQLDCSPTKRKLVIGNADLDGSVDLSMNGEITGYVWFTGNVAGKFNNVNVPVADMEILPGTTTVIYNGQSIPGYVFTF